jgi:hypothetical protein
MRETMKETMKELARKLALALIKQLLLHLNLNVKMDLEKMENVLFVPKVVNGMVIAVHMRQQLKLKMMRKLLLVLLMDKILMDKILLHQHKLQRPKQLNHHLVKKFLFLLKEDNKILMKL